MTEEESSKRLQQLLRLKRHESPPPGYFREFSSGVIDRIRVAESEKSVSGWRRWFFGSHRSFTQPSSGPASDERTWPMWGWAAAGFAALLTLSGGLYWASGSLDAEGGGLETAGMQAVRPGVGMAGVTFASGSHLAGASEGEGGLLRMSEGVRSTAFRAAVSPVDGGFRWPVSVSMAGTSSEISSTNPFPPGLFRLPGASGGGSEAYRVRFGDTPR